MKKSHQEINKEREVKYGAILKELGIFWAFSDEQFNEQKVEGVTYVGGAYGECIPEQNVDEYLKRLKELGTETKKAFAENVDMDEYIAYELGNHEAFYTGEIDAAMSAVIWYFPDVTEKDMWRVYRAEWAKYKDEL